VLELPQRYWLARESRRKPKALISEDYYAILGVGRDATAEDIKSAYRRLARLYHPDLNPGTTVLGSKFQQIGRAYAVLGCPSERSKYDLSLIRNAVPSGGNSRAPRTTKPPPEGSHQATRSATPAASRSSTGSSIVLCRNCRASNVAGDRYCHYCGAALPLAAPRPPASGRQRDPGSAPGSMPNWKGSPPPHAAHRPAPNEQAPTTEPNAAASSAQSSKPPSAPIRASRAGLPVIRPAHLWERCGALIIDAAVCTWLIVLADALEIDVAFSFHVPTSTIGSVVALSTVFAIPLYALWYWSTTGRTVGNVCLGIRVSRPDGARLGVRAAASRALWAGITLLPLGLGLWFAARPDKLAAHDHMARTVVRRTHRRWDWIWWRSVIRMALALTELGFALANLPR